MRKEKVLAVDDNPVFLNLLEDILKRKGYENVRTSTSGKEALNLIKEDPPNLVLLDMKMPEMDGIETLKEIRKINPDLKVIMLTAVDSANLEREAREIGVSDFLRKELGIEVFLQTLDKILKTVEA